MGPTLEHRPLTCAAFVAATLAALPAAAQEANAGPDRLAEVVVTAQKREQSINDVGLTIQAASGDALQALGVQGPEDLPKLVPGFTYTKSVYSTPVFTLRGIGLYDATFGAVPAVAVYTDQVPRNFPVMSDGLDLDVARVEVLKGPQGTLFGQSSTGGAINYIMNKPTQSFQSGVDFSYERFDKETVSAFVSGPVTEKLRARLAVRAIQGGAWQYSQSRPGDELGATRKLTGRLTADWVPVDQLSIEGVFTASRDRSDPQAPQFAGTPFNTYSAAALAAANANPATRNPYGVVNEAVYAALTDTGSPGYDPTFLGRQGVLVGRLNDTNPAHAAVAAGARAILDSTDPAPNSRVGEWTPGFLRAANNSYFQGSVRADYRLTDTLTLTSISAYAHEKLDYNQDLDGTAAAVGDVPLFGTVRAFNQEVRLAGTPDRLNWIVGASYDDDASEQNNYYELRDYSQNAGGLISLTLNEFRSTLKSYGAFANGEYKLAPSLTASAGVRYTKTDQTATYCYNDPVIDASQGTAFIFQHYLETPPNSTPIGPGQCFVIGDGFLGSTKGQPTLNPLTPPSLNENNVSYRAGMNYKFDQGTLLYATVSQGYKAGLFSAIGASNTTEYHPAVQEKLIDYEAGFKAPLLDRRLNLNGAVFYYDYTNKQVRGRVQDPVYGLLEKLLNVPKSAVYGVEGDVVAVPLQGLRVSLAATYLESSVTGHFTQTPDGSLVYNAQGYRGDFKNSTLPYTPKLSGNADAEYEWNVGAANWAPFVGADVFYQGGENATFHNTTLPAPDFEIASYATLDVRAGVRSSENKWQVTAYCHNITSKYFVTSVSTYLDTRIRFTGMPAVYGVSVRVNVN